MSGTIIITKNSTTTSNPGQGNLNQGELAYSFLSQKLFIGDASSPVNDIVIGGKHFTDMLDHNAGTLTASSAIITDSSNKIDTINVDNLTLDANTISTSNSNGSLVLDPNGSGAVDIQANTDIVGNLTVSGTQTITGQSTFGSVNVTDLTSGRVLLAGTSGELEDSSNLTFDGSTLALSGAQTISSTLTVTGALSSGAATLSSAKISDLTDGRVVLAGTAGEVEDSGNLTFDGSTLAVTGNETVSGTLDVNGQATLASLNVEDLTTGRIPFSSTSGELQDSSNLTYSGTALGVTGTLTVTGSSTTDNVKTDGNTISATNANGGLTLTPIGTGVVTVNTDTGLIVASGLTSTRPTATSIGDGAIRYNESTDRFEGTVGGSWTGLGGVVDVDQDTYITAEESADDDTLRFYAAGTEEMKVEASGVTVTDQITAPTATITTSNETTANIGTANVTTQLQVDADANFTAGIDVTAGDVDIDDNLNVGGNAIITGNLTVNGTTTAVNSSVTTLNDPVIKVGDGSLAAGDSLDRGINLDWGNGTTVKTGFFGMDMQTERFSFKPDSSASTENYSTPWGDAQFGGIFLGTTGQMEVDGTGTMVSGTIDCGTF